MRQDDPASGRVKIRVGLHSGPTTAVVIGRKSPKYTLLGDTVNTARFSRFLSNYLHQTIEFASHPGAMCVANEHYSSSLSLAVRENSWLNLHC